MAPTELSSLSQVQLIELNGELDVKRNKAVQDIKKEQFAIQEELSNRGLLKRAESLSDEDLKLLAKLRKDHPSAEEAEVTEDSSNG